MHHIVKRQSAAFAVLQPFLCRLIPADVKLPCGEWDAVEMAITVLGSLAAGGQRPDFVQVAIDIHENYLPSLRTIPHCP